MMKKITLLIGLSLLVSTITVEANNINTSNRKFGSFNRYHQRPVTFQERNIFFYVYPNGDLDFELNTYSNSYYGSSYYYRGNRKQNARIKHSSKKRYSRHYGHHNYIAYDYYGRVKRIGNTFIRYDFYGRVIAINGITISYRHNRLSRVGNLRIVIDRYGHIRYIGSVKPRYHYYYSYYNDYFYDNYVYEYDDDFFSNDDFEDNYEYFEEDENFYYYRSKNKHTKKGKNGKNESKQRLIKRRKSKKN